MSKTAFVTRATEFHGLNFIQELSKQEWKIIALYFPSVDLKYISQNMG